MQQAPATHTIATRTTGAGGYQVTAGPVHLAWCRTPALAQAQAQVSAARGHQGAAHFASPRGWVATYPITAPHSALAAVSTAHGCYYAPLRGGGVLQGTRAAVQAAAGTLLAQGYGQPLA